MSGTTSAPNDTTRTLAQRRARKRLLIGGAALIGAAACTWLALNLTDAEPPALLWTAADLPPVPADNGWAELTADLPRLDLPEPLRPLQGDPISADVFWQTVETQGDVLHTVVTSKPAVEALAQFDRARSHATLADACMPNAHCPTLPWHKVTNIVELRALDQLRMGQLGPAVDDLDTLLRMNIEHLASARSMISAMVALSNLASVLVQVDMLAAHEDLDAASAARLARRVEAIAIDALDLRTIVKTEYIWLTSMLADGEFPDSVDIPTTTRLLYDPGETLTQLNERFAIRHDAAALGDTLGAFGHGQPRATDSFGWWLDNPAGKLLIDATLIDPQFSGRLDESKQEVSELRTRVLASLATRHGS